MTGDRIPLDCTLAMHCKGTSIERDENSNPTGINTDAFRADDDGISCNWIEHNGGNFASTCALLKSVRSFTGTHMVAVMGVRDVEDVGTKHAKEVHAVHDPLEEPIPNPGHALITGIRPEEDEVLQALSVIVELRPFP